MKNKHKDLVGPGGRWLLYSGIPVAIVVACLVSTVRDGNIRGVSEFWLPYVVFFVPLGVVVTFRILYPKVKEHLSIKWGIAAWIFAFAILFWFTCFGPASVGYQH